MAKAQADIYLSKQSNNWGQMGQVIIKGNQLKSYRMGDLFLVWTTKKYPTERILIEELQKAINDNKDPLDEIFVDKHPKEVYDKMTENSKNSEDKSK